MSEAELEQMLLEADANKDGVINYEEFVKMLASIKLYFRHSSKMH